MSNETVPVVLGLDLGPNSVGWALVDAEAREGRAPAMGCPIIAAGVRVFEAGIENYGTHKEQSRSQKRRAARSARRVTERRGRRRRAVRNILQRHGLLPRDEAELRIWIGPYAPGDRPRNPYAFRARGLDEALQPYELGVAIYHLAHRRGFQSNRKDRRKVKELGPVKEGIGFLGRAMDEADARTLGEYLYRLQQEDPVVLDLEARRGEPTHRLRNRHTSRAMYKQEFEALWDSQREHLPKQCTDAAYSALSETLFFQRPYEVTQARADALQKRPDGRPYFANLLRSPSVGRCPLVPEAARMPRTHWRAQRFRLLKEVNNLAIRTRRLGSDRRLSAEERARVLDYVAVRKQANFTTLRNQVARVTRDLDPEAFWFNLEAGSRKALLGNTVEYSLIKAFGKSGWSSLDAEERMRLRDGVSELECMVDDEEEHARRLRELLGEHATPEMESALSVVLAREGHMRFSREAIDRLLPHLEAGLGEYDAIEKEFPERGIASRVEALPLIPKDITNPVVRRALSETRRVVNAIIKTYGLPQRIQVELARDAARTGEQRKEATRRMRDRERAREAARDALREHGIADPGRSDVLAFELWQEQNGRCIYTGDNIGLQTFLGFLRGSGELQVDHILPRWRSGDDGYMNKVICRADANRAKGDRTPIEWLSDDPEGLAAFRERVAHEKGLSRGKARRLLTEKIEEGTFTARQLNDTRYISREIVSYLERLYPPELRIGQKAVGTTKGQATAQLRYRWGLNSLLPSVVTGKATLTKREDHLHHAVDALVVALVTPKHVQAMARADPGRRGADRQAGA